jgi:hypothetical protein
MLAQLFENFKTLLLIFFITFISGIIGLIFVVDFYDENKNRFILSIPIEIIFIIGIALFFIGYLTHRGRKDLLKHLKNKLNKISNDRESSIEYELLTLKIQIIEKSFKYYFYIGFIIVSMCLVIFSFQFLELL